MNFSPSRSIRRPFQGCCTEFWTQGSSRFYRSNITIRTHVFCWVRNMTVMLVLRQGRIDEYRTTHTVQDKAQPCRHSHSMSNGCNAVLGGVCGSLRAREKRPSAVLSSLELATASPAVVRLAAEYFSLRCIYQSCLVGVLTDPGEKLV